MRTLFTIGINVVVMLFLCLTISTACTLVSPAEEMTFLKYELECDQKIQEKELEIKQIALMISGKYKYEIAEAIVDVIPQDEKLGDINLRLLLIVMARLESSNNPLARSSKGAIGVWQIMVREAKLYGYEPNEMEDIRKNLLVAKKILHRKNAIVSCPWRAVKYYNGTGYWAVKYQRDVKKGYRKLRM